MKAIDEGGSKRGHYLWVVCVDGDGLKIEALRAEMENSMEENWVTSSSQTIMPKLRRFKLSLKLIKKLRNEIQSWNKMFYFI